MEGANALLDLISPSPSLGREWNAQTRGAKCKVKANQIAGLYVKRAVSSL